LLICYEEAATLFIVIESIHDDFSFANNDLSKSFLEAKRSHTSLMKRQLNKCFSRGYDLLYIDIQQNNTWHMEFQNNGTQQYRFKIVCSCWVM